MLNISTDWEDFETYPIKNHEDVEGYLEDMMKRIAEEFSELDDEYHPAYLGKKNGTALYHLIREKRPEIVVETGVANGLSSSIILKALDENGEGRLYSVDMPYVVEGEEDEKTGAVIPPGRSSGWAVPESLKGRWELILGDTFNETPKVLEKVEKIDIFIHDSDHSYEGMMFEFSLAWRHLRKGGVLLADNIDFSDAFSDFSEAKGLKKYRAGDLGMLIKS